MGLVERSVQECFGYVTKSDREAWERAQEGVANERRNKPVRAMLNDGVQTLMDYTDHQVQSQMRAEYQRGAEERPKKRIRVIEETEQTQDIGYGYDEPQM